MKKRRNEYSCEDSDKSIAMLVNMLGKKEETINSSRYRNSNKIILDRQNLNFNKVVRINKNKVEHLDTIISDESTNLKSHKKFNENKSLTNNKEFFKIPGNQQNRNKLNMFQKKIDLPINLILDKNKLVKKIQLKKNAPEKTNLHQDSLKNFSKFSNLLPKSNPKNEVKNMKNSLKKKINRKNSKANFSTKVKTSRQASHKMKQHLYQNIKADLEKITVND